MKTANELARFYVGIGGLTIALSAASAVVTRGLIVNLTESMPLGVYRLVRGGTPALGDRVAFPVPIAVRELVRERRYLPERALLLKEVVAAAGDEVCTEGGVLAVGGRVFGPIAVEDSRGRPLPHPRVCGTVPAGELYVASRHPRSFDSRAFGLIDVGSVRGKVVPLWTF